MNFIRYHDGLTMNDWISNNRKHNEATGDDGRDESDITLSWSCRFEGLTNNDDTLAR